MSVYSFVPVLLTALIGFLVYRYRNRLGYSVITIRADIPDDNDEIKLKSAWGGLKAERLKLKNYGLRNLESVELHLIMPTRPVSLSIKDPSTLSKKSVKTEWHDEVLTILLASFPSKEEIEIDMVRVGHYEPVEGRLKGTGGKYKIVRLELHEVKRKIFDGLTLILLAAVLPLIGSWLDRSSPSPQPASDQVPVPTNHGQPLAPANTKGDYKRPDVK